MNIQYSGHSFRKISVINKSANKLYLFLTLLNSLIFWAGLICSRFFCHGLLFIEYYVSIIFRIGILQLFLTTIPFFAM